MYVIQRFSKIRSVIEPRESVRRPFKEKILIRYARLASDRIAILHTITWACLQPPMHIRFLQMDSSL